MDGCGDGPADGVAGGGARRSRTLSLRRREHLSNHNEWDGVFKTLCTDSTAAQGL